MHEADCTCLACFQQLRRSREVWALRAVEEAERADKAEASLAHARETCAAAIDTLVRMIGGIEG